MLLQAANDSGRHERINSVTHRVRRRAYVWLGLYVLGTLLPLLALLPAGVAARGGLVHEFALGLGLVGLAMLVMQFWLTARLRRMTAPFGIDVIYYFHRFLALTLCAVILLHPVLLQWQPGLDWSSLGRDTVLQTGLASLLLLVLIMLSSLWRRQFALAYQHWRRLHLAVSVLALALAFVHVWQVGWYTAHALMAGILLGMMLAVAALVLHVHLLRPFLLWRRPWRIAEVRAEHGDCWTLTLEPLGHAGLDFMPGQFAWLSVGHTPFSLQEHPFSFSGAPRRDGAVQFTIKELGDFTRNIGNIQAGTTAWVDGPYGVFSCDRYPDAAGYVFFGGGIGIAPILSMLQALAERGDARPHVLFAAHSRFDRVPRREELVALRNRLQLLPVPVLEEPPEGWQGECGWLTPVMLRNYLVPDYLGHEFFLCGPKPMTDLVEHCLRGLGVPAARIHMELFAMA